MSSFFQKLVDSSAFWVKPLAKLVNPISGKRKYFAFKVLILG